MSLLYTKGDKIFIKREGTIEMPNRSHFAARRKRNLTVPLLALFLLIGFAAGLAVPRLGSSAPAVSAADGTASGKPDSSASSPDASAAVYIAPDDAAATAYISRAELEVAVPSFETVDELTETHVLLELEQLAAYFEDGRYWNHYGMDASSMNDWEQALLYHRSGLRPQRKRLRLLQHLQRRYIGLLPAVRLRHAVPWLRRPDQRPAFRHRRARHRIL